MSVNSGDIEQVANALMAHNNEASYRSGASRFYYSGWHLMQESVANSRTLAVPKFSDTKGGMHKAFFEGLHSQGKTARACALKLVFMHKLRIAADYKLEEDFLQSQGLEVKHLLDDLKALSKTL